MFHRLFHRPGAPWAHRATSPLGAILGRVKTQAGLQPPSPLRGNVGNVGLVGVSIGRGQSGGFLGQYVLEVACSARIPSIEHCMDLRVDSDSHIFNDEGADFSLACLGYTDFFKANIDQNISQSFVKELEVDSTPPPPMSPPPPLSIPPGGKCNRTQVSPETPVWRHCLSSQQCAARSRPSDGGSAYTVPVRVLRERGPVNQPNNCQQ